MSMFRTEAATVARFGLVGILATLTHAGCVIAGSVLSTGSPLVLNTFAFLVAFIVAGVGHSFYTFRLAENRLAAIGRYFFLSVTLLGLSNAVLYGLSAYTTMNLALAKAIAIAILPAASYVLSRFWAFKT